MMIHLKQGPWSQQDSLMGEALAPEPEDLSSDPRNHIWKERTNNQKLLSDVLTHFVALMHMCRSPLHTPHPVTH